MAGKGSLRITQVVVAPGLQVVIQLVHQRNPGGDVQFDDCLVAHPVEVLHERAEAVAVCRDQHPLAAPNRRRDRVVPVRQETCDGVLERLGERQLRRRDAPVARVVHGVARVVGRQRRRRDIVAAAPNLHLRLAVFLGGLCLVQPLQRAVVTLVEPPVLDHREPELIELVEGDPERADRALEHRRVGDVEREASLAQQASRLARLLAAAVGEIDVGPAREAVFLVPGALAVSEQYECGHGYLVASCFRAPAPA
jgi:hypothetical protein